MSFIEIAQVSDVPAGSMKVVSAGDKKILIANVDGQFYAINNRCIHMGGDLSKGKLTGKVVTCPRHKAEYDVTSGEVISKPGRKGVLPFIIVSGFKVQPVFIDHVHGIEYEIRLPEIEIGFSGMMPC